MAKHRNKLKWRLGALLAMSTVVAAGLAGAPALAASNPKTAPNPKTASVNSSTPCAGLSGARSRIEHVIVLFMENQPYKDIVGNPDAPYANGLAERCGLATNYHNITHPSAPEYLAATSGNLGGAGDCPPVFLDPSWPPTCPDTSTNIFQQTMAAGLTWKVYQEDMATNCFEGEDSTNYDINHNPAAYYTDLGGPSGAPQSPCKKFDVPMGSPVQGNFETDLASGNLPNYSFISPNLIHDTHNGTIAQGDQYLSQLIPTILNSPQYKNGTTVLFLGWDEGEGGSTSNCAYNTTDIGCHVAMIVVSPYVRPGTQSSQLFNHYSLFKTSEQLLGLPFINHAKDPRVKSMAPAFHL
jgi:phosphatidylinositol-3-phosphatase